MTSPPPATRILFVRHAETDANAGGRAQGHRDVPLNERGRAQAATLARALRDESIVAVYASDSSRSVDTGRPIAEAHGLEVQEDARLREVDQGDLDGLTSEQMRAEHPEFIARWRGEDPADLRIPGGETLREAQARMVEAVEAIAESHPGRTVVVVSHNLSTRMLLCHVLRVPVSAFRHLRHGVACLAEVHVRRGAEWTVVRLNEQCHLDVVEQPTIVQDGATEAERPEPGAARATR